VGFSVWLALVGTALLISFTPGAGAINIMAISLAIGWRRTLWAVLGQQVAILVYIVVVAAGLGALVVSHDIVFETVRYLGVAYLVYLGIRQLIHAWRPVLARAEQPALHPQAGVDLTGSRPVGAVALVGKPRWSVFRRGFFVNITNPKAIVFFLALMPQFVRPANPLVPQYAAIAATIVTIDIAVMWLFFGGLAHGLRRVTASPRGDRLIGTVFGVLFILVAALLALIR
jgi:homoserine/homoserine lactone efflux protein